MALELIASPVLEVLFDRLGSLISREYHLLSGFNKDLEKLSKTLSTIQTVLEDAETKQIKDKRTKVWLSGLKDAAYDAEDVLDELEYEALKQESEVQDHICTKQVSESLSACFDFKQIFFRRKMAKRIKQVIEKFNEIDEERSKFQLNPGVPVTIDEGLSHNRETSYVLTEPKTYGRDEEKSSIIQILLGNSENTNDLSICPIVGIGGLGKTTLAQLVYNDREIESQFTRIWISVSKDFSVKRIIKMIIDYLTEKKCDLEDLSPMQNLVQKLLNGRRYLLVLDDVWDDKNGNWNAIIMFLLKCEAKGSSIIVTTRLPTVVDAITPLSSSCVINPTFNLKSLPENDSWSLFAHYALGLRLKDNEDLVIIGKEIVDHCNGVPLAIKTVASLLNCDREERWRAVRDSEIWHLEDRGDDTILPALRLSFYDLPPHFRQCFAHCSVYPKGWPMSKERLIHGWMANGLIHSRQGMEAEDVGDDIFNGLLQRSFFQEFLEEFEIVVKYKMHDLLHELACSVTKNECTRMMINEVDNVSERVRHVSVRCNSASPQHTLNPLPKSQSYIRTLMFHVDKTSYRFGLNLKLSFSRRLCLKHLRVLDLGEMWNLNSVPCWIGRLRLLKWLGLESTGITSLPEFVCELTSLQVLSLGENVRLTELPPSLGKLKNLRYLGLSETGINVLPDSICMLSNLQTLNLEDCEQLERLPSDLKKLKSLRNLIITNTSKLLASGMPVGIGDMTRLEVLGVFVVGNREGAAGIQELGRLKQLKGKLRIEGIRHVRDPRDALQANLKNKHKLSELELYWGSSEDAEDEQEEKRRCQVLESLEPHSNLQKLEIDGYSGVELPDWLVNCAVTLPNLQELLLLRMLNAANDLRQLPPNLKKLWIVECPKLRLCSDLRFPSSMESLSVGARNDPTLSSLEALPHLSQLIIEGYSQQETLLSARLRKLTCIRKLLIDNCSDVKSLLPKLEHLSESLRELRVYWCDDLDCITEEGLRNLASLQLLEFKGCSGLKSISDSPSSLQHLRSLTLFSLVDCPELDLSAVGFQHLVSLKALHLEDLPQMTSLPDAIQHVKTLEGLSIKECKNLQMLPEWLQQHLPLSLYYLQIRGCGPELHKRCEMIKGEDWPKISHLQLYIILYYIIYYGMNLNRASSRPASSPVISQGFPTLNFTLRN